jgi:hypothetical protein
MDNQFVYDYHYALHNRVVLDSDQDSLLNFILFEGEYDKRKLIRRVSI